MAKLFFKKQIKTQRTLGEKLRIARRKKRLSLLQAEEETRVRLKYLEAFERGNYQALPADVYSLGFLAKYAELLKLKPKEVVAEFRREKGSQTENVIPIKAGGVKEKFFITPKIITIIFGILLICGLVGYIFYSMKHFTAAPNLEISSPSTDTVIREDRVQIIGKTDLGCSLRINDQTIYIDALGNFQETIRLQPGINNIEIRSTNRIKKENAKVIKILAEY